MKFKRIVLIGFMSSGKTDISKLLAQKLKWDLIDTDHLIEEMQGRSIPLIFEEEGQERFRKYETEALQNLSHKENVLISTGGGIVMQSDNHAYLKDNSFVIYLRTEASYVLKFCGPLASRPLLNVENPEKVVEDLLKIRDPIYSELSDWQINSFEKPLDEITQDIYNHLQCIQKS